MAIFEKEGATIIGPEGRSHLDRNWNNGNGEFDAVNKRIDNLGKTEYEGSNEVTNARTDVHGKTYLSFSSRADATQLLAEKALEVLSDKADMEAVQETINEIVSGTPKGTYPTLTALQQALTNGAQGIYITQDDGHWHYYDAGTWKDGGKYQGNIIDFLSAEMYIPGLNLLTGTSAQTKSIELNNTYHAWHPDATNGEKFAIKQGLTYTYRAYVAEAQLDSFVLVDVLDSQGKVIQSYTGNHVPKGKYGWSTTTFTVDNPAAQSINVFPIAMLTAYKGNVWWSNEMLEYGPIAHNHVQNLAEMDSGKALANLVNLIADNKPINSLTIPGVNLLTGTLATKQTEHLEAYHLLTKAKNGLHLKVKSNTNYVYHAMLEAGPDNGFVLVEFLDSNLKQIDAKHGSHFNTNNNLSILKFNTGDKIKYVNVYPVAYTASQDVEVGWSQEMLEPGTEVNAWNSALSELSLTEAIAEVFTVLNSQISQFDARKEISKVKTSGINLLEGTSKNKQSESIKDVYHAGTHASNANRYPVEPNTIYSYHVKLSNLPKYGYCLIQLFDKDGKVIPATVAQRGNHVQVGEEGVSTCTFYTGDNIASVTFIPVAFSSSTTGSYNWAEEMLEYGPIVHKYQPAIIEQSFSEALLSVIDAVHDEAGSSETANSSLIGQSLPVIKVTGDLSGVMADRNTEAIVPVEIIDKNRHLKGYIKTQMQGNSSTMWLKKGFKFKLYEDSKAKTKLYFQPTPTMYRSNNFQLKAYYTDKWHIRDLAAAEIVANHIANNDTAPKELLEAAHFGTIDGMPCLFYINEQFYGLMTLKTHTSSTMFNMDEDNPNHIALENDGDTGAGTADEASWKTTDVQVGRGFSLEGGNETNAQKGLEALAEFVVNSSDEDFVKNFEQHFNLKSALDYILSEYFLGDSDAFQFKNNVYLTYDGQTWFMMPYDFDSSLDGNWQPGHNNWIDHDFFKDLDTFNRLNLRIVKLMPDKLLERFNELDAKGVYDPIRNRDIISRLAKEIGSGAYQMEWERWSENEEYAPDNEWNSLENMNRLFIVRRKLLKERLTAMQK